MRAHSLFGCGTAALGDLTRNFVILTRRARAPSVGAILPIEFPGRKSRHRTKTELKYRNPPTERVRLKSGFYFGVRIAEEKQLWEVCTTYGRQRNRQGIASEH